MEVGEGVSVEDIRAATGASFQVDTLCALYLTHQESLSLSCVCRYLMI